MARRNLPKQKLDKEEALRREIERLRQHNEELERERERLRRDNERLRQRLETMEREVMRPAAPFRIDDEKRKREPRKPGRKPGHPGACRKRPKHVDEEVAAPLPCCPKCGGAVANAHLVEQFIEDLPEIRPRVTRVVTYTGRCDKCGIVGSSHPRQMSTATAAAGVQVGPRALAVAMDLNKRLGVPLRKTCDVLWEHFGLQLTAGGLVHAQTRLALRLEPQYQALIEEIRRSKTVYTDETSWWVGGPGFWLWVFTASRHTVYVVDSRRNKEVVTEVLRTDFSGVLSSDCLNIYDTLPYRQNKCYAHHLKAIAKAIRFADGDTTHLEQIKSVLKTAVVIGKLRDELPPADYARFVATLELRMDALLAPEVQDIESQKVIQRLRKQRDHLFTFLHVDDVSPTNNAAERALRPAVVARKISCGNRTDRGRRTWQTLASLAATCRQQDRSFVQMLAAALPMRAPPPDFAAPS